MVQIRSEKDCDHKTCKGSEYDPTAFGGWRCECSCHWTKEQKERWEKIKSGIKMISTENTSIIILKLILELSMLSKRWKKSSSGGGACCQIEEAMRNRLEAKKECAKELDALIEKLKEQNEIKKM